MGQITLMDCIQTHFFHVCLCFAKSYDLFMHTVKEAFPSKIVQMIVSRLFLSGAFQSPLGLLNSTRMSAGPNFYYINFHSPVCKFWSGNHSPLVVGHPKWLFADPLSDMTQYKAEQKRFLKRKKIVSWRRESFSSNHSFLNLMSLFLLHCFGDI